MRLLRSAAALLFPPKCVFCRKLLDFPAGKEPEERICERCRSYLPLTRSKSPDPQPLIDSVASPYFYKGRVRQSLLRYKFGGLAVYADTYASLMAESVRWECPGCEVITWAPLSRRRKFQRGYDQAQLLAEALGRKTKLPVEPMLMKVRNAAPQSSMKSAADRRKNIVGCYVPLPGADAAGRRVLLVDDIFTTGSTLNECAKALLEIGASSVCAATVARGVDEE